MFMFRTNTNCSIPKIESMQFVD